MKITNFLFKRQLRGYSNTQLKDLIIRLRRYTTILTYEQRKLVIAEGKRRGLI